MTGTHTTSSTFTSTHAEYIASKVMADLRGMRAYYGQPDESLISDFYAELTELLLGGYLASVEYGFKRNGRRIVTLRYEVRSDGSLQDTASGRVFPRADISNADRFSFLTYSAAWHSLPDSARRQIQERIPVKRTSGQEPQDGDGYWVADKSYSSQGVGAQRRMFRPR